MAAASMKATDYHLHRAYRPVQCSILSERRVFRPYGLHGGEDGQSGRNVWIKRPRAADGDLPLDVDETEAEPRRVYLGGKPNCSLLIRARNSVEC